MSIIKIAMPIWVVKLLSLITFFFLIIFAPIVSPAGAKCVGVKQITGGVFTLETGEELPCDLLVSGGQVVIEAGAVVPGSVAVYGGQVDIAGEVQGNVTAVGGKVILRSTAWVGGEVTALFGSLTREAGASVQGSDMRLGWERFLNWFSPLTAVTAGLCDSLGKAVVLGLLALGVQLFRPQLLPRLQPIFEKDLARALVVGPLALVVFFCLVVTATLSICLIPIGLGGLLLAWFLVVYGWLGLGAWLGKVVTRQLRWDMVAPPVVAMVGVILLSLLTDSLKIFVPGIWYVVQLLLALLSLGAASLLLITPRPAVVPKAVNQDLPYPPVIP